MSRLRPGKEAAPKCAAIIIAALSSILFSLWTIVTNAQTVVPDDTCTPFIIDSLYEAPAEVPSSDICVTGVLRHYNSVVLLLPPGQADDEYFDIAIVLTSHNETIRYGDIRSGDLATVRGRFAYNADCYAAVQEHGLNYNGEPYCAFGYEMQMFVLGLDVLNRPTSGDRCLPVSIVGLFSDPLAYNERIVCVEGYAYEEENAGMDGLWWFGPEGYAEADAMRYSIDLLLSEGPGVLELGVRSGDRIAVRGRFIVVEDCYRQEMLDEQLPGGGEAICWPVAAPMYILFPQIEIES